LVKRKKKAVEKEGGAKLDCGGGGEGGTRKCGKGTRRSERQSGKKKMVRAGNDEKKENGAGKITFWGEKDR